MPQITGHSNGFEEFDQSNNEANIEARNYWPFLGESSHHGEFPSQWNSYAEGVSLSWRHYADGM